MPRKIAILILTSYALCADAGQSPNERLLFVGDVLLSRNVAKEITQTKRSPWHHIQPHFQLTDYIVGNLEGAVGSNAACSENADKTLCFAVAPNILALLKSAGFKAMSLENNHSEDLGSTGKQESQKQLNALGIDSFTFEGSPWFVKLQSSTLGIVAYSSIANGQNKSLLTPNLKLAQKIRLAKQLSNVVIVYIHWGNELQDWPNENQRNFAKWLISVGADLIVGHHPHVIQTAECIEGKPVVFSLGNHVFDQKYPLTKIGQMLICTPTDADFKCEFKKTIIPSGSAFPKNIIEDASSQNFWKKCNIKPRPILTMHQHQITPEINHHRAVSANNMKLKIQNTSNNSNFSMPAHSLLWLTPVKFNDSKKTPLLLTLQTQFSSIDQEKSPRPYVYDIGPNGLIAKWRGSALAWPLLDITTIYHNKIDYLCALHRGDSFLMLDPKNKNTRIQVYQWNGFGFSASKQAEVKTHCENYYNTIINRAIL